MTLDELEGLADAATPPVESFWYDADAIKQGIGFGYAYENEDAAFLAACTPETIKALIALCRMQHEALNKWYSWDSGDEFKYSDHIEATDVALAAFDKFGGTE